MGLRLIFPRLCLGDLVAKLLHKRKISAIISVHPWLNSKKLKNNWSVYQNMFKNKVIVAMSGGVDSSVAAALLKEKGYEVIGAVMKIWSGKFFPEKAHHSCYGPGEGQDIEDARKVAQILKIPFYIFDLGKEYKTEILNYFYHEYLSGRTPNPCVRCNRMIKLGALVEKIQDAGIKFDYIATGHYARVKYDEARRRYLLRKALDLRKDQSYFLFSLSQEKLRYCLFPLGDYTKEEVRKIARNFGLGVSEKLESQNFITGGYSSLFKGSAKPGPIFDKHGNILGEHRGIPFYTIGQRRGLGISARNPLYVTAIDREKNAIFVGTKEELYKDELIASQINWIAIEMIDRPLKVRAKIRSLHKEAEAVVSPLDRERVNVKFKEPQMAITPGQAVVFYDGDIVVGGGTIE